MGGSARIPSWPAARGGDSRMEDTRSPLARRRPAAPSRGRRAVVVVLGVGRYSLVMARSGVPVPVPMPAATEMPSRCVVTNVNWPST